MVIQTEEGWRGIGDTYYDSWQEAQESIAKKFGWEKSTKSKAARKLRAFLSYVHEDKPLVLELYEKLAQDGVEPWIDKRNLVGGQVWKDEITEAIRDTDAFIACLSTKALTNRGYFRKEIKEALSVARRQPKGSNFLIPLKLEECNMPIMLRDIHSINYYESDGFLQFSKALRALEQWIGLSTA